MSLLPCRHQVRQTSFINFLIFILELIRYDKKHFSAPPCIIGMNTFCFQHCQISLSCLAELTVALHPLSVNTRSDSPFSNTDAKMERTEETARESTAWESNRSANPLLLLFLLAERLWLVACHFRRGKVVDYSHPYFAWVYIPVPFGSW